MSGLPMVAPQVVADAIEALPSRLRSKLDEVVRSARHWPVASTGDGVDVRVDEEVIVHLRQAVRSADDVRCTCLLAPRCLHRAAVLCLAPSDAAPPEAQPEPETRESTVDGENERVVSATEVRAAHALWRAAASVLETGIPGAGAVTQAALLRAAHDARAASLHRGAAASIRVVEHLRAAATEDPAFRLADLVRDLRELLSVAHRLRQPDARIGAALRGTARREYRVAAGARLYGLCVEPVATASGYGGAVTLLADAAGTVWQVSTVVPGGADVARFAARRPVSVGEVRLSHTDLGRAGLLATSLSASTDGRIGAGRGTSAVRADGVTWFEAPLDALWQQPGAEQVDRYLAALERPPTERPAVAGLFFIEATVVGATEAGLALSVGSGQLLAVAAHDSPELAYVDNLRLLARATGASLRIMARPVGRRRVAPIAFAAEWLPEAYGGHVDLGLDRLRRADLPHDQPAAAVVSRADDAPPLRPLLRRLERAVEGGRAAIPGDATEIEGMRAALPYAAELAQRLEAASRPRRDVFGRVVDADGDDLARAWLAGATYVQAALRSAERAQWTTALI